MKSISNNLLASEQTIVKQMTDDSLQELSRLQAVAAALQERPDGEEEPEELYDYEEELDDEEAMLASMDEGTDFEEDDTEDVDTALLDDMDDTFDDFEEPAVTATLADIDDTELLDDIDDGFEDDAEAVSTETTTYTPATSTITESEEYTESEELDDGFDEDSDGFEDSDADYEELDDGFEEDDYEEPIVEPVKKSVTSTPIAPPGATLLRPPVSAPIAPPTSTPIAPPISAPIAPPTSTPVTAGHVESAEDSLLEDMDDGFEDDEQDAYSENFDDESYLDEEISDEIEIDEQYVEKPINRGINSANSFEKAAPVSETPTKFENSGYADDDPYVTAEIEDFLDEDEGEELDLSVLETVPLVETAPGKTEVASLEAENERLRRQLAELENEKLKKMLAEQTAASSTQQQAPPPIKLNIGVVMPKQEQTKQTSQPVREETDKERAQRQRWTKYAAMTTQDLWKHVYRFMTMAGVQKAPVKAKLLVDEFGSRNIKRLEATYIMATKDGYTC